MTSKNLAVIFGPTLLRDQDENRDLLEMNHKISTIEFILNHMDTVFVIETNIGKSNNQINTAEQHRKMHLPPLQRGEDFGSILGNYKLTSDQDAVVTSAPAVPPRHNAGYI
jgi:hypothetical protein